MNKTLLAIALFGLAAGETSAQQIGRVARVEPVRYEKRDGAPEDPLLCETFGGAGP